MKQYIRNEKSRSRNVYESLGLVKIVNAWLLFNKKKKIIKKLNEKDEQIFKTKRVECLRIYFF